MKKGTIYRYIGKYLVNHLRVPYTNPQGKLMFYGDGTLRLKKVINDKHLKRYSNRIAARICLKQILDDYFIGVRSKSHLDSGYQLTAKQSTKQINQQMNRSQLKREKVTVKHGRHTETLNLPPLSPKDVRTKLSKAIQSHYLVPDKDQNGYFVPVHRIGTDEDGKPVYKHLRLRKAKSDEEFSKYYKIVPRTDVQKGSNSYEK